MSETVTDPECLFCRILSGEIPGRIVAGSDRAVALMDINPATRGHLLVLPRSHTRDVVTAPAADLTAVALLAQEMAARVRDRLGATGVNLVQSTGESAWQTVFHLHVHVIPRYPGDPLVLPWQPAPGDSAEIDAAAAALS